MEFIRTLKLVFGAGKGPAGKGVYTPLLKEEDGPGPSSYKPPPSQPFFSSRKWGVALITLSAISYGLSASIVSMEKDIPTPIIIVFRFLGAFVITAICCLFKRIPVWEVMKSKDNAKIILCRSIFGLISFTCGTYAFQNMPVGEATVIISMAPVFVSMFSVCFLGERLSWTNSILVVVSIFGVVLIVDPGNFSSISKYSNLSIIACCTAIGQALSKAVSYIFLKKSNNKIYYLTMIFWYAMFGTLMVALFMLVTYYSLTAAGKSTKWIITRLDSKDLILLPIISVLGFVSQITLTKAAQMINTTIISLIRNGDIIITLLFQIYYFKIVPCWVQILGIIVMVLATFVLIVNKERERVIAENALDDYSSR